MIIRTDTDRLDFEILYGHPPLFQDHQHVDRHACANRHEQEVHGRRTDLPGAVDADFRSTIRTSSKRKPSPVQRRRACRTLPDIAVFLVW